MRMQRFGRPQANALNMHQFRFWRPRYQILSWRFRGNILNSRPNNQIFNSLSPAQKASNTTRGTTPGLLHPSTGLRGGVVPLPNLEADEGFIKRKRIPKDFSGLTCTIGERLPQTRPPFTHPTLTQQSVDTSTGIQRRNVGLPDASRVGIDYVDLKSSSSEQADVEGIGEEDADESDHFFVTPHAHSSITSTQYSRHRTRPRPVPTTSSLDLRPSTRPTVDPVQSASSANPRGRIRSRLDSDRSPSPTNSRRRVRSRLGSGRSPSPANPQHRARSRPDPIPSVSPRPPSRRRILPGSDSLPSLSQRPIPRGRAGITPDSTQSPYQACFPLPYSDPPASPTMVVEDVDRRASGNEWLAAHGLPPVQDLPGTVRQRRADERRMQRQRELNAQAALHLSQHSRPGAQGIKSTQGLMNDVTNHMLGHGEPSTRRNVIEAGNRYTLSSHTRSSAPMRNENLNTSRTTPAAPLNTTYNPQNQTRVSLEHQQRFSSQTAAAGTPSFLPPTELFPQPGDQGYNITGTAQDDGSTPFASWDYGQPPRSNPAITPYASHYGHLSSSSSGGGFQSATHLSSEQNLYGQLHPTSGSEPTGRPARPLQAAGIAGAIANPSAPPYQGVAEPTDRNGGWTVTFVDPVTGAPLWTEPAATPSPVLNQQPVQYPVDTRWLPRPTTLRASAPQQTPYGAFQSPYQSGAAQQGAKSQQQAGRDMTNPFRQMHPDSEYDAYMENLKAVFGRHHGR